MICLNISKENFICNSKYIKKKYLFYESSEKLKVYIGYTSRRIIIISHTTQQKCVLWSCV